MSLSKELKKICGEVSEASRHGRNANQAPPKDSAWFKFAKDFDIGILDLDNFAALMGFDDYDDLDISISPRSLYKRNSKKFTKAIRDSALRASDMADVAIDQTVNG